MFRSIILSFLCLFCIEGFHAQMDISSSLLKLEQEIYISESDSISNDLIIQKIGLYLKNGDHSKSVLQEFKRLNFTIVDSLDRSRLFWNATLIAYFNDDVFHALHYFEQYEKISDDSTVEKDLLKVLIYSNYNSEYSSELVKELALKSSNFQCLECLTEVRNYEMKHKLIKQKIAYFIPGMGLLLNGNGIKGATSILLNASTVIAIRWMFLNSVYLNMIGWGSNMLVKFYIGNINLTSKMTISKEKRIRNKKSIDCSNVVFNLLEAFPLEYR
jgi:hypothetical protein